VKPTSPVIFLGLIGTLVVWYPSRQADGSPVEPEPVEGARSERETSANYLFEQGSKPDYPPSKPRLQTDGFSCPRCSLVLVSIDTLRADHLGCYGYGRNTSPNIDRMAGDGILFERAHATSYVTADSHMSIFTSLYPSVHGVRNASVENRRALRLHPYIKTLPEILREAGYVTGAITGGGNAAADFGFDRGMDSFQVVWEIDAAVEQATRFIEQHQNAPFFLFFHTYHVHDPYLPGPRTPRFFEGSYKGKIMVDGDKLRSLQKDGSFAEQRRAYWGLVNRDDPDEIAYLVSLYDGEIWEVDHHLGRLLGFFRLHVPDAVIIVTSDHGEQFLEHGDVLHNDLYQELLHVPLIIAGRRLASGIRIRTPVSLIDLAPTALDLMGLPAIPQFQGRSLAPTLQGRDRGRDIFSEKAGRKTTLLANGSKLIVSVNRLPEFYDLNSDAGEKSDLTSDVPRVLDLARQLGETIAANHALGVELRRNETRAERNDRLDSSTEEQLKALGYME
jgi:arylsulfatase A-like enzyme